MVALRTRAAAGPLFRRKRAALRLQAVQPAVSPLHTGHGACGMAEGSSGPAAERADLPYVALRLDTGVRNARLARPQSRDLRSRSDRRRGAGFGRSSRSGARTT